ncbi:ABC transporter substrate-binding protein [Desulfobacterota bacterium AH_259_B03_O07]|nr:ABC transporter substrate-binding protein [Desulfobacterota bacterium AH_259_B03_O07]
MWFVIKQLSLGIFLIIIASSVLLFTDRHRRAFNSEENLQKVWKLRIIEFTDVLDVEECRQGVVDGLRESGLVEGKDYVMKIQNAQGDMATVNVMVDSALSEGADMLITLSTPTLQAALNKARGMPIIFTYISDPISAGAGTSNYDHLPNVTGVYMASAYGEMLEIIKELIPETKALGTLFVSSEVNSVFQKDMLVESARNDGLDVVAIAADTSADVPAAALALGNSNINAICQIPGNLTASAFPSIARAAQSYKLPIFAFQSVQAYQGATLALARDYYDAGKDAAFIAARVMRGEDPGSIPFQPVSSTTVIINLRSARALGLKIPESIMSQADEIIGE